jgi:AcrR family transcriptional regulator
MAAQLVRREVESQRERVYEAAMNAVAELGPERATLRVLGARLSMSPGHILYYFGNKDRLLRETLRWSEEDLQERARSKASRKRTNSLRLHEFVSVYLPTSARDPRWLLWAHIYARPPRDREGRKLVAALDQTWLELLSEILVDGEEAGEFRPLDAAEVAQQACVFMDGLAVNVLLGDRKTNRDWAMGKAVEWLKGITAIDMGSKGKQSHVR